jgi:hypothetical protein
MLLLASFLFSHAELGLAFALAPTAHTEIIVLFVLALFY